MRRGDPATGTGKPEPLKPALYLMQMTKDEADVPVLRFEDRAAWSSWLETHHASSPGLWLKFAKEDSGIPSVTHPEALEVALCYGWIDGLRKPLDESWWLQMFAPRGPKSLWSLVNRHKAEALIQSGEMKPAGLKAIEVAKEHGRWDSAYISPVTATMPGDFQAALNRHPKAKAFFESLPPFDRHAFVFRIHTAHTPEARAMRIRKYMGMLERGEKVHR
jgi:uncharacterized protein YdeI (YjbR/CyaY-like superfamily)